MFDLKPLNPTAIAKALQKADRYRLLNEAEEAESICLDILLVAPDHPEALVMLMLALSDQFRTDYDGRCYTRARELIARLPGDYERHYFSGHPLRASRERHPRPGRFRAGGRRLPAVPPGDGLVREGRGRPAAGQRRRPAPLEHLRPDAPEAPPRPRRRGDLRAGPDGVGACRGGIAPPAGPPRRRADDPPHSSGGGGGGFAARRGRAASASAPGRRRSPCSPAIGRPGGGPAPSPSRAPRPGG